MSDQETAEDEQSPIRDTFSIDSAFMCVECSVLRWGFPTEECPACGEEGVHKVVLRGDEDGA